MLHLSEAARDPTSTEPLSYSLSRPTADGTFIPHNSVVTYSYDDRPKKTPLRKHHAQKQGQKLGTSHEL